MVEQIRFVILLIGTLFDTMPQVDTATNTKIEDAAYAKLIADGVMGVVTGMGYTFPGFTDAQLQGGVAALCRMVSAYKAATRVAV